MIRPCPAIAASSGPRGPLWPPLAVRAPTITRPLPSPKKLSISGKSHNPRLSPGEQKPPFRVVKSIGRTSEIRPPVGPPPSVNSAEI